MPSSKPSDGWVFVEQYGGRRPAGNVAKVNGLSSVTSVGNLTCGSAAHKRSANEADRVMTHLSERLPFE